jgi:hypothetical protein
VAASRRIVTSERESCGSSRRRNRSAKPGHSERLFTEEELSAKGRGRRSSVIGFSEEADPGRELGRDGRSPARRAARLYTNGGRRPPRSALDQRDLATSTPRPTTLPPPSVPGIHARASRRAQAAARSRRRIRADGAKDRNHLCSTSRRLPLPEPLKRGTTSSCTIVTTTHRGTGGRQRAMFRRRGFVSRDGDTRNLSRRRGGLDMKVRPPRLAPPRPYIPAAATGCTPLRRRRRFVSTTEMRRCSPPREGAARSGRLPTSCPRAR